MPEIVYVLFALIVIWLLASIASKQGKTAEQIHAEQLSTRKAGLNLLKGILIGTAVAIVVVVIVVAIVIAINTPA